MEKAPFSELVSQAWKASTPKAPTLFFGMLVASGMMAEQLVAQALWQQPASGGAALALRDFWVEHTAIATGGFLLLLLAHAFGQANLIAALSTRRMGFRMGEMISRFIKTLAVDVTAGAALCVLAFIFAAPPLLALLSNRGAFEGAALLSIVAFLPVALVISFIRQYGLFYHLLSPLRLRSSVDRGAALFSKFFLRSLGFWIFSIAVAAVFTFFLNAAMLGTSSLFMKVGLVPFSEQIVLGIGFIGFVWFMVFDQALSLRFFEDLASERDSEKLASGEHVLDPSMPAA